MLIHTFKNAAPVILFVSLGVAVACGSNNSTSSGNTTGGSTTGGTTTGGTTTGGTTGPTPNVTLTGTPSISPSSVAYDANLTINVPVSANAGYVAVTLWQQVGSSTMTEITSQGTWAEVINNTNTTVSVTVQALASTGPKVYPGFIVANSNAIASINGCNNSADPNCAYYTPTSDANTYEILSGGHEGFSTIPLVYSTIQ